ncbi:protein SCAR4-like isoform X2 [Andrographis paniculata]|uniref:protein SCAR4-like isoform X2 n=1 Tax=Andrographis paniculata TaxID=175694 RepID=UPI0021E95EBF|nr:protein SCAR4-like isoform X2 [Andrographis paniculata]
MPISRFEIKNMYSLADSDLYCASDKDDPEALLEGVAMAGLVGLLRQLGDLAEFAAEIFHNLHEEVIVTAARGHNLMIRIQQLEAEVPSIERSFLSQTDHSSCFYDAGVDWHPNLQIDVNLVTHGDLPRFIMDSYEECRAPPRLFMLDKFDVAGTGSCLKRYSDPSFFKEETTNTATADVQREKKILKLKRKGHHGRNGETAEIAQTSHANYSGRVKLKRRLNGFPFDSNIGKSYMENILKSPSSHQKVLHEVDVNSLSSLMPASIHENEFGLEALEVRPVSPDRGHVGRERRIILSAERKDNFPSPSSYEPSEVTTDDQTGMIPNHNFAKGGTSSTLDKVTTEKVIAVNSENNSEGCLTGFESNAIASEVENFVDATSIMETEVDTEDESEMKNDSTAQHTQSLMSDANDEHSPTWMLDCQSSRGSIISDEGNNSSSKEIYGCSSSESASTSVENPQSEKSTNRRLPADTPEIETVASSSPLNYFDQCFSADQHSQTEVCDDASISTDATNRCTSDFEQLTRLCKDDSLPTSMHSELNDSVTENKLKRPEYDETSSTFDDDEKMKILEMDQPCYSVVSDFELHSGGNSEIPSAGQFLVNEVKGEMVLSSSSVPEVSYHITDSSATSFNIHLEDETYPRGQNLVENSTSSLNVFNVIYQSRNDTPQMKPSTNPIPVESDEVPKFLENLSSDYPDIAYSKDVIESVVPQEENPSELNNEDLNGSIDASKCSSVMMGASFSRELNETLSANDQTVDAEEKNRSNSSTDNLYNSENLMLLHLVNSPDRPQADLDADEEAVIPEQDIVGTGTFTLGSLASCEVVQLQATGMTDFVFANDSEALGRSFYATKNLEKPSGASDSIEMDGIALVTSPTAQEVTEVSDSTVVKTPTLADIMLEEPDSKGEILNIDMGDTKFTVSDNTILDNTLINVNFKEEVCCSEESRLDELESDRNCVSGSLGKSGTVEEVGPADDGITDSEAFLCNRLYSDHPKLEKSDIVPSSLHYLEAENELKYAEADTIQPLLEQSVLGTKHEFFRQCCSLGNEVPDAMFLPLSYGTEEFTTQERIGPSIELDQESSDPGHVSSALSSLWPMSHQKMLAHDNSEGNNSSAITFHVDHSNLPSVSELQRQSNYDDGVSGYTKDPLGSISPQNNPFSKPIQMNLVELPPLPPLPPVQWRMGMFLQNSTSTRGEVMQCQEIPPQSIFQPLPQTAPSTKDVSFSSATLTPTTDYVNLSPEEMTQCPFQTTPKLELKEKEAKNSCSTLEFKNMSETIDVVPKMEGKQQPVTESCLEEATHFPNQSAPKHVSIKEEEANSSFSVIDAVSNIEDKKQQSLVMTVNREFTAPQEDGHSHGGRMVKLPRSRNPLVEDIVALDRSKLRKVTESERPWVQKGNERDAFLEQIRDKSFKLKPAAMASRASSSIQQRKTNLRVAAILEKANAMRQAIADSSDDDDDDDACWE